jgi:hypothetical protein
MRGGKRSNGEHGERDRRERVERTDDARCHCW